MDPISMILGQIIMSGVKTALTPSPPPQVAMPGQADFTGGDQNSFGGAPSGFRPPRAMQMQQPSQPNFFANLLSSLPFGTMASGMGDWMSGLGGGGNPYPYGGGYGNLGGMS